MIYLRRYIFLREFPHGFMSEKDRYWCSAASAAPACCMIQDAHVSTMQYVKNGEQNVTVFYLKTGSFRILEFITNKNIRTHLPLKSFLACSSLLSLFVPSILCICNVSSNFISYKVPTRCWHQNDQIEMYKYEKT